MKKGETIFQKWGFLFAFLFQVLVPPLWSIKRVAPLCQKWLDQNPKAYTPHKALANLYIINGQYKEAIKEFIQLQKFGYLTDKGRIDFAEALFKLNKFSDVVELLSSIIEKYPMGHRANQYLGKSYMEMGKFEEGIVYLERFKKNVRGKKLTYHDYWALGFCYSNLGQFDKALEVYNRGLTVKPNLPGLRENVAYVHCQRGLKFLESDLDAAEKEFMKALHYWPNSQRALDGLIEVKDLRGVSS